MKLSTNESQASLDLDQWERTTLTQTPLTPQPPYWISIYFYEIYNLLRLLYQKNSAYIYVDNDVIACQI